MNQSDSTFTAHSSFNQGALHVLDLTSDTEWTARLDSGPPRPIRVPGGGWNSDEQAPPIPTMGEVRDHVLYEREISIPREYAELVALLRFGAVNYGAEVFVDGNLAGRHDGAQVPFDVDLTSLIEPGTRHKLSVKAYHRLHYYDADFHDGKACMLPVGFDFPADSPWMWAGQTCFSYGITGRVEMAFYPRVFIGDLFVKTSVAEDQIEVVCRVENRTETDQEIEVSAGIGLADSQVAPAPVLPVIKAFIRAGESVLLHLGPVRWGLGSESYWWPNIPFREDYVAVLNRVEVSVASNGESLHRRSRRFGFCQHDEGDEHYRVNGVRVNFFGDSISNGQAGGYDPFSRCPAFFPEADGGGCAETWRRYQRVGFNCVRLSSSVPTEAMLDAADETGFMLIGEGGTWGNNLHCFHPVFTPGQLREMIRVYRGHPSVARYSLANEVRDTLDETWPWRPLIDVAMEEDGTRPLVFELHTVPAGRIDGVHAGHAHVMQHYASIVPAGLRGMGEFAWATNGLAEFGLKSRELRLAGYAYLAPWSWLNYWPNFLDGMSHARHPWKVNNHPDRIDGLDGWGSPVLKYVQDSLHPFRVADSEFDLRNNFHPDWPVNVPRLMSGRQVQREIAVFNGGLRDGNMELGWELRWEDDNEGDPVAQGQQSFSLEAGFHVVRTIKFEVPEANGNRRLALILTSLLDGDEVFREDRLRFAVMDCEDEVSSAAFIGEDRATRGDWHGRIGSLGHELCGVEREWPAHLSIEWVQHRGEVWEIPTKDPRALLRFVNRDGIQFDRVAACHRPKAQQDQIEFVLDTGGAPLLMSLYFLDWDKRDRSQVVSLSSDAGTVSRAVNSFHDGVYLQCSVKGRIRVSIAYDGPGHLVAGVVSGLFLDPVT